MGKLRNLIWPPLETAEQARKAANYGVIAAVFISLVTALVASWAMGARKTALGFIDGLAFIDAIIFACVAFGIYKRSRFAAIAGLAFFLYEKIYQVIVTGHLEGAWMAIILTVCFVHATRGVYALCAFVRANIAQQTGTAGPSG
jgi:hypothetical protein